MPLDPAALTDLWVYLRATPLLWLTLTLIAYLAGVWLQARLGGAPWINPVAVAVALVILALIATDTAYPVYFDGAQFIHFLLGPATVALAVPLFDNARRVRRALVPLLCALVVGSVVAIGSAVALAALAGAPPALLASLAPKSITTPIAMAVSERLGGLPQVTAVLVILTGILGATVLSPTMRLMRLHDPRAIGLAAGLAAHGIGAARAFQIHPVAGAFAGLAMGLNGLLTSVLVPMLASLPAAAPLLPDPLAAPHL